MSNLFDTLLCLVMLAALGLAGWRMLGIAGTAGTAGTTRASTTGASRAAVAGGGRHRHPDDARVSWLTHLTKHVTSDAFADLVTRGKVDRQRRALASYRDNITLPSNVHVVDGQQPHQVQP